MSQRTPTPAFTSWWSDIVGTSDPAFDIKAETIILKSRGKESRHLEYADVPKVREMRGALEPINEMLRSLGLDV